MDGWLAGESGSSDGRRMCSPAWKGGEAASADQTRWHRKHVVSSPGKAQLSLGRCNVGAHAVPGIVGEAVARWWGDAHSSSRLGSGGSGNQASSSAHPRRHSS